MNAYAASAHRQRFTSRSRQKPLERGLFGASRGTQRAAGRRCPGATAHANVIPYDIVCYDIILYDITIPYDARTYKIRSCPNMIDGGHDDSDHDDPEDDDGPIHHRFAKPIDDHAGGP